MSSAQWYSRKGNDCTDNRDFGAFLSTPAFELAVIVDASRRGALGADLARDWGTSVVDAAKSLSTFNPDEFLPWLRNLHGELRYQYLTETASYAIAGIDHNGDGWAMSCGDCRVGLIHMDQKNWLTPVHTLANAIDGAFERRHAVLPSRHTVTRCWKSKRFAPPEVVTFAAGSAQICMATDGHWLEHEWLLNPLDELMDDASCLVLHNDAWVHQLKTDCNNFHVAEY